MIELGQLAPDFTLEDQTGAAVSLSSFRGAKNVVLFFYPKDNTSVCTKEACLFRDENAAFAELDAEVLGISTDSVSSHAAFAKKHGFGYRLLADPGAKVAKRYGASTAFGFVALRVTYVIDKEGRVRHATKNYGAAEPHVREAKRALAALA